MFSLGPSPPTVTWAPRERFDPLDAGAGRGTGYTGYTETFAAATTVQQYLALLPDEDVRIVTCGFAFAYLTTRMGEALPEDLSGEVADPVALEAAPILGWLAEIHRVYPDNGPPDSSFVASALRGVALDYARGRSLALGQAYMRLATHLLVKGLEFNERSRQLDAQKAISDLDPDETRRRLAGAAREGIALALLHAAGN